MLKYFKEQFPLNNFFKDVFSGIIVALVSIPISMGYAQVAGLSPVYGLYGSLLPILLYGLISSSKQFVVGVDAMPAAMVGALLTTLGIESGSEKAAQLVPVITLLVALWFIIFFFIDAGRIVKYISNPVMGGFISGVGITIILMVFPKVLGGSAGTGDVITLLKNLVLQYKNYKPVPILLGLGTIIIIQISKKFIPKAPMSVIVMVIGAVLSALLPLSDYGVVMLPDAPAGLPKLNLPNLSLILEHPRDLIMESLMIALVIMAQTLLATNSYAQKKDFKINSRREMLAYSAMNVAGCAVGICPINGSVSRSGLADSFGAKSHIMSITSAIVIAFLLLFGTPLLKFMPTPVMTGVVVCALIGILDFKQAIRLIKTNRQEFFIFFMAFAGVLAFGTIYGVVIGMALSFFAVIIRAVIPPRAFLGQIPGHGDDFYNMTRNVGAKRIESTIIYRFGGNLFFANIGTFVDDIEGAIDDTTKVIIVDARGIGNIDITAADRLVALHKKLSSKGIKFYLTEHAGIINDQLRKYGAESLIYSGAVRRTISLALRDAGIQKPYPLIEKDGTKIIRTEKSGYIEATEMLAEFEWAFGEDAEMAMSKIAEEVASNLVSLISSNESKELSNVVENAEHQNTFGKIGLFDEDELLDYLEIQLDRIKSLAPEKRKSLLSHIEKRRKEIEAKLEKLNPKAENLLHEHRIKLAQHMRETHPEEYRRIIEWEKHYKDKH